MKLLSIECVYKIFLIILNMNGLLQGLAWFYAEEVFVFGPVEEILSEKEKMNRH